MDELSNLQDILDFLGQAEALKHTLRTAWTSEGRRESTAEHTWRLCLLVMLCDKHLPDIDHHKLLKICIIHDLAEAITGDISATLKSDYPDKSRHEKQAMLQLTSHLDEESREELLALWQEYEDGSLAEVKLAKAFDKLETLLQQTQGKNPANFDYAFNLKYGNAHTQNHELTRLLRQLIDSRTQQCLETNTKKG